MVQTSALDASSLSSYIASSLPKSASPQLKSPTDAIAIACHAGMLAVGFRLVGLGEDHRTGMLKWTSNLLQLRTDRWTDATASQEDATPLPIEWNASSEQAFRYKHQQSSMEYLLKVSRLGSKTIVNGIATGDDKPVNFHLNTADFVSASSLPATPVPSASTSTEDAKHAITSIFISPSRLTDLGSDLRVNIIQRLIPSLQKEGYEETPSAQESQREQHAPRQDDQRPRHDPLRQDEPPARPRPGRPPFPTGEDIPPGFEDEYEIMRPPRGWPPAGGQGVPGYGERDLYPQGLGPHDPLRTGGVGPGFRGGPGGGMHPTFDDPLFGGRDGGQGYDPQAPPGARFDPVGPGMGPPRGSGGRRFGPGGGGGAGGFGAPQNPFSGFGSGDFI